MASSKVKGITIDLDVNANGINESLKSVNKELGSTAKELKQVEKGLKLDPSNVVLLSQKQKLLSDAIDKTSQKLQTLSKYKEQAEKDGGLDKNTKEYRDLERQIEDTKNALGKFRNEQDNVTKSLDESTSSLNNFGLSFKDVFNANLLSNIAIKGIEMLTNALIDLSGAMYGSVVDSGKFADDINTLAKQYNLSTKELQVYTRASELLDVDVNTIAKSMSKLTKNMTSNSSGVVDAFKKLGIQTKEADGSLRDSNQLFYEVIDALSQISNETEQDSLALEIFGKSAAELGTLINGGAEQLDQFNKYLEENNLLLSQGELDQLNEMNDSFDNLSMTFDALKDKLGTKIAPLIQPIVDGITTFMNDHRDDFDKLIQKIIDFMSSEDTKNFFTNLFNMFNEMGTFVDNLGQVADKLGIIEGICNGINRVISNITNLMKDLNDLLDGNNNLKEIFQRGVVRGLLQYLTFAESLFSSGGFGDTANKISSGGFMSGGITLNNNFNITNGNNINEQVVSNWADIMVEQINSRLGEMI